MSICLNQNWNKSLTRKENNISVFGFVPSFHSNYKLVTSPFLMYLLFT